MQSDADQSCKIAKPAAPSRFGRWGALCAGLILVFLAWKAGFFSGAMGPRAIGWEISHMGPWGYLAFIGAFTILQPFGVPGTIFTVAAPLIWPWPVAFTLSLGSMLASSALGFAFARFVARDWVSARVPRWLREREPALERSALQTVVLLRLCFGMLQALHSFFGVSNIRFRTYLLGCFVGYIPQLLVITTFSAELLDGSGNVRRAPWPILGGLVVLSLAIAWCARVWERRRFSKPNPG